MQQIFYHRIFWLELHTVPTGFNLVANHVFVSFDRDVLPWDVAKTMILALPDRSPTATEPLITSIALSRDPAA